MGVGKSTIGRILSKKLGLEHCDIDNEIEKKEGIKVSKVFSKFGEGYFRKLEKKIIIQLLEKKESLILSLGGGAYLNQQVREIAKKKSISIWLNTDIKIVLQRLEKSKNVRPVFEKLKSMKEKEDLFKKRNHIYGEADIRLNTGVLSKEDIANLSLKYLRQYLERVYEKSSS